jgi:hypothetical protein
MDFDVLSDLNWLAVIVAALAYFVLGGIWYAPPVFGKAWMAAAGMPETPEGERPGPAIYLGPFVGSLLGSIAMAMLAKATGSDTLSEGLVLGLVTGIGFAMALIGTTALFETQKPRKVTWFWITALYHAVSFVLVAAIVSAWK